MTVCLAVATKDKSDDSHHIILCSDWRVSNVLGSSDTALKTMPIIKNWYCMFSGETSEAKLLHIAFRAAFVSEKTIDETNIVYTIKKALYDIMNEKIESFIRGRFGISYKEFLNMGKDKFPPDVHRETILEVSKISIKAESIVVGFAKNDFPYIAKTGSKCDVKLLEDFAVIGEGAYLAEAMLRFREVMDTMDFKQALYCAYEAKKFAERVPSVGDTTNLEVVSFNRKTLWLTSKGEAALYKQLKKLGPREVTENNVSYSSDFLVEI